MLVPGAARARYHRGMDRLNSEWRRLYAADDSGSLVDGDGRVRALVLDVGRPADWSLLSAVWRGVQSDLGWPAPGIAVNGRDGYQLWFSLREPVPAHEAQAALRALAQRFLPGLAPARVRAWPQAGDGRVAHADRVPRAMPDGERWSAFVAPDLAAVFGEDAALDLPPGDDAQADLLARLAGVAPTQWAMLKQAPPPVAGTVPPATGASAPETPPTAPATQSPGQFLMGVMNDPAVDMALRIEAAKALLQAGVFRS